MELEAIDSALSRQQEDVELILRSNQDVPVLEREYWRFELGILAAQSVIVNTKIVYRTQKQIYTGFTLKWKQGSRNWTKKDQRL